MKKLSILLVVFFALLSVSGAEGEEAAPPAPPAESAPPAEPAPPPAPEKPNLDELIKQLMTFTPEEIKAKFDGLKAEAAKMQEDAKNLRAQADALDAKAAELLNRVKVLEELVGAVSMLPTSVLEALAAAPKAEEKMMAAVAPPAPTEPEMPAEVKEAEKPKINYADHVAPIMMAKCASCHNQDKAKGDLAIETYEKMMAGGGSGAVIVPGDPSGSRLFRLITHEEEPKMPLGGSKLDDASLETIRQWIEQGALKDKTSKAVAVKKGPTMEMAETVPALAPGEAPIPIKQENVAVPTLSGPLAIKAVASSPGAPVIAVAGYRQIIFYHADTFELLRIADFPEGVAETIRFSPNGALLVAAGGEAGKVGLAAVYDVQTGTRVGEFGRTFDTVLTADISLDHRQVVVGGTNKKVRVYSTETGEQQYEISKHTDWIQNVAFSPDGWFLATGDRAGNLYIWQAPTGRDVHELRGHDGPINDLAFRADSNVLASASGDGKIILWEMSDGKNMKSWSAHAPGALSVEFARDGRVVSSGADQLTVLWQADGKKITEFPAIGDWAYSTCLAMEDSKVLTGSWQGEVKVWETAEGKEVGTLKISAQ